LVAARLSADNAVLNPVLNSSPPLLLVSGNYKVKEKVKSIGDLRKSFSSDETPPITRRSLSLGRIKSPDSEVPSKLKSSAFGSKSSSASSSIQVKRSPNQSKSDRKVPLATHHQPQHLNGTQSKVKLRLQAQQQQQQRQYTAFNPKTPIMKFKEKFPHHSSNTPFQLPDSDQLTQLLRRKSASEQRRTNFPKTVPGVRTGGLSPTRDRLLTSGPGSLYAGDSNSSSTNGELETLRARIKEMYLSGTSDSNSAGAPLNDSLSMNDGMFSRPSSAKLRSLSRSVSDFLASGPLSNQPTTTIPLSTSMSSLAPVSVLDMTDSPDILMCPHCATRSLLPNAKYCHECGARRLMSLHSFL
jgi:hypothetical protein